jgi:hypothetical protein
VTQGWVFNHTVNQAFDASKGGDTARPKVLAPDRQAALLAEMDLADLFKLAPATVTVHPEPLPRSREAAGERQVGSASPCYAELVVSQIFYDHAPMAGRSLKSLVLLRRFGASPAPEATFSTWTESDLQTFPAKVAADARAADEELITAYRSNLRSFAIYAAAPKTPRKR